MWTVVILSLHNPHQTEAQIRLEVLPQPASVINALQVILISRYARLFKHIYRSPIHPDLTRAFSSGLCPSYLLYTDIRVSLCTGLG